MDVDNTTAELISDDALMLVLLLFSALCFDVLLRYDNTSFSCFDLTQVELLNGSMKLKRRSAGMQVSSLPTGQLMDVYCKYGALKVTSGYIKSH